MNHMLINYKFQFKGRQKHLREVRHDSLNNFHANIYQIKGKIKNNSLFNTQKVIINRNKQGWLRLRKIKTDNKKQT